MTVTLIAASALTLSTILAAVEDFSTRIGLPIEKPLKTETVTKSGVHPEDGDGFVIIQKKYTFTFLRSEISYFADLEDDLSLKLTRLDPAEMKRWSEEKCILDEKQALQVALDFFHKLGFRDEDFEPPQCHQYRWQPSEQDAGHVLLLPAFHVKWLKKGVKENDYGFGEKVVMAVSGKDKRLLFFRKGIA
jgi:hypothetical protein